VGVCLPAGDRVKLNEHGQVFATFQGRKFSVLYLASESRFSAAVPSALPFYSLHFILGPFALVPLWRLISNTLTF